MLCKAFRTIPVTGTGVGKTVIIILTQSRRAGTRTEVGNNHKGKKVSKFDIF